MQKSERSPMIDLTEPDLGHLGYTVTYFRGGRGCVVWDEGEEWIGVGADAAEALRAAVAPMLPSRAARFAVETVLAQRRAETLPVAPEPAAICAVADTLPATTELPCSAEAEVESVTINASTADAEPESSTVDAALGTLDSNPVDVPPESAATKAAPIDVHATIEALDAIEDAVIAAEPELAMMAPEIQRLQMFAWIARARAVAEPLGNLGDATRRTRRIASHLGRLAKSWWPGRIEALKLTADPAQSLRGLVASDELSAARPETWGDAADAVAPVLAARLARVPFDGGWSDARTPKIEEAAANADVERAARDVDSALALKADEKQLAVLVDAARHLRSARRGVTNHAAWGALVGKLREYASQAPGRCVALLRVLDPTTVPTESWAHELRHERRPETEAALRAARSPEQLARALITAFDVLDKLALARMLADRADEVACITDDMLPDDRRTKRRFADLRRALKRSADVPGISPPEDSELPVSPEEHSPLRLAVRQRFAGKSVLFVSNREDPELKAALTRAFGFVVTWYVADPRRIGAARDRIAGGGCDLVLAATGFLDHSTDQALASAARAADVPYVRVDRGRVLACELALAREFGLAQASAA